MIKSIKLTNYRNYNDIKIDFLKGINIIIGDNGVGKTSLIEAIYIAYRGKSWRSNLESITKKSKTWWRIDLETTKGSRIVKFGQQKTFEINHKLHQTLPRKLKLPIVLFEPDDLNLLFGSPSRRRRWLDNFLADCDPNYSSEINKFERVLKQRNLLLKNQAHPEQLFVWDLQFSELSANIINKRQKLISDLNQKIKKEYNNISNRSENIEIKYSFDGISSRQAILDQLQKNYQLELRLGSTSIGPQKHDIETLLNSQPAATTASRGESRSIIIALKKIEYDIKKSQKPFPLILLDDILSELDDSHKISLLKSFNGSQVIITTVNLPKINQKVNIIKI
jgi:DNA replication and repair protein RecF